MTNRPQTEADIGGNAHHLISPIRSTSSLASRLTASDSGLILGYPVRHRPEWSNGFLFN